MKKIIIQLSLVCMAAFILSACSKPAYENMPASGSSDQTSQTAAPAPAEVQPAPASPAATPQAAEPAQVGTKAPSFFDPKKGGIKDLPAYKPGYILNVQHGPWNGQERMMIAVITHDPIEKVGEFYEKAIKSNGWTVKDSTKEEGHFYWSLKKGETSEAGIDVKADKDAGRVSVAITRREGVPKL